MRWHHECRAEQLHLQIEDLEPIELVNVELTEPTAPRVQRLATAV